MSAVISTGCGNIADVSLSKDTTRRMCVDENRGSCKISELALCQAVVKSTTATSNSY